MNYRITIITIFIVVVAAYLFFIRHPFIITHGQNPSVFLLKWKTMFEHINSDSPIETIVRQEVADFEKSPLSYDYRIYYMEKKQISYIVIIPKTFSRGAFIIDQRHAYIFDINNKTILSFSENDAPTLF